MLSSDRLCASPLTHPHRMPFLSLSLLFPLSRSSVALRSQGQPGGLFHVLSLPREAELNPLSLFCSCHPNTVFGIPAYLLSLCWPSLRHACVRLHMCSHMRVLSSRGPVQAGPARVSLTEFWGYRMERRYVTNGRIQYIVF